MKSIGTQIHYGNAFTHGTKIRLKAESKKLKAKSISKKAFCLKLSALSLKKLSAFGF
jgi:hypothetical protein